jgi:hypothetical protein
VDGSTTETTVIVSGYRIVSGKGRCVTNSVINGRGPVVPLGMNLSSDPTCQSELVIFQRGRAAQLMFPVRTWTAQRDRLRVSSTSPRVLRLALWIVNSRPDEIRLLVSRQVSRARELFLKCGISVQSVSEHRHQNGSPLLSTSGCDAADRLKRDVGFDAGRLNVYYLTENGQYRGAWCGQGDQRHSDILLIYKSAAETTLAHEIGHALALGHPPFLDNNLMADYGSREHLTVGQCFRCNFDERSLLNVNQSRSATNRRCESELDTAAERDANFPECPPIDLDSPATAAREGSDGRDVH